MDSFVFGISRLDYIRVAQHLQDVCAILDGVIGNKLQLRRVAQAQSRAQLTAEIAGGTLESLDNIPFLRLIKHTDKNAGIAQITCRVNMRDGHHAALHAGILQAAEQTAEFLLYFLIDAIDTIACHSYDHSFPLHFKAQNGHKRDGHKRHVFRLPL